MKQSKIPEHSLALRYLVLAAMLVPLLAIGRVAGTLWPHLILAGLGIGLGHWYSYHFLARDTRLVRGVMFIAIHLTLVWLVIGLASGFAVPQAQFAIFTQAITSFEGRDRFSLCMPNGAGQVELDFPNDTTRYCVGLVKAVEALVGAGQVSVQAPTLPERPTWVKRERS